MKRSACLLALIGIVILFLMFWGYTAASSELEKRSMEIHTKETTATDDSVSVRGSLTVGNTVVIATADGKDTVCTVWRKNLLMSRYKLVSSQVFNGNSFALVASDYLVDHLIESADGNLVSHSSSIRFWVYAGILFAVIYAGFIVIIHIHRKREEA